MEKCFNFTALTTEFLDAFVTIKSLPVSVNSIEGLQYTFRVLISFLNVFPFNVSNPYKLFGKPVNCFHYFPWSKSCGFVGINWLDTLNVFHIFLLFCPFFYSFPPFLSLSQYSSIILIGVHCWSNTEFQCWVNAHSKRCGRTYHIVFKMWLVFPPPSIFSPS